MKKLLFLGIVLGLFAGVVGCGKAENPKNAVDPDAKVEVKNPPPGAAK